jgi:predicted GH43/DUF377 family glycosyl hydrolase
MITIKRRIILSETDLDFENDGVLNPAIMQEGNTVHVFYRAVRRKLFYYRIYKIRRTNKVVQRNTEPLVVPSTTDEIHGIEDQEL